MQSASSEMVAAPKIHVLFLLSSISFPNGMAPTQRVMLLARCLSERGMEVSVLCTQVTERGQIVENQETRGIHDGIEFEYSTGTTVRSTYFIVRRWHELQSILVAVYRLAQLKHKKIACCVYYYGNIRECEPGRWFYYLIIRLLNLPLITEVGERPWSLAHKREGRLSYFSPLSGVQGAVVISDFLRKWAEQENGRLKKNVAILQMPILVDVNKQLPGFNDPEKPYVLFASSSGYMEIIQFILAAMVIVWNTHPECVLVITGSKPGQPESETINKIIREHHLEGRVELTGYLSRIDLLQRYTQAAALLIPLFDDLSSKARFPTKLGEYLASGRPVVTTNVGEMARHFTDKENAYVCAPGNPDLYGQKISAVLENWEEANRVGAEGRRVAEKYFHYRNHADRFANFIKLLALGE